MRRDWLIAYNFAKQLEALKFRTPHEAVEELRKSKPDVFIVKPDPRTEQPGRGQPLPSGSSAERRTDGRGRGCMACSAAMRFSVAGCVEKRSETLVGTM